MGAIAVSVVGIKGNVCLDRAAQARNEVAPEK